MRIRFDYTSRSYTNIRSTTDTSIPKHNALAPFGTTPVMTNLLALLGQYNARQTFDAGIKEIK